MQKNTKLQVYLEIKLTQKIYWISATCPLNYKGTTAYIGWMKTQ